MSLCLGYCVLFCLICCRAFDNAKNFQQWYFRLVKQRLYPILFSLIAVVDTVRMLIESILDTDCLPNISHISGIRIAQGVNRYSSFHPLAS